MLPLSFTSMTLSSMFHMSSYMQIRHITTDQLGDPVRFVIALFSCFGIQLDSFPLSTSHKLHAIHIWCIPRSTYLASFGKRMQALLCQR